METVSDVALCHLAAQEVLKAEEWRIAEGRVGNFISAGFYSNFLWF